VVGNVAALGLRTEGERGLLGIAFHPDHAANKVVYLYYTTSDAPNPHNRVSRFTVDDSDAANYAFVDTAANPATLDEVVILNLDPLSATNHNGGAIHFGPDRKLYVATGDNAVMANSQSLATRHGKVLRINPNGTIPADNPASFAGVAGTTSGANRAIWALGLRNPFTFTFDPATGVMFVNDVGAQTWEEVNVGGAGRNFGWPATEGHFDPAAFPAFTNPRYAYSHGGGTFQGFAITGGAFYSPPTDVFPAAYAGDYFFADFVNDWVNVINADGTDVRRFATNAGGVVDLKVTTGGSLLYLSRVNGQVFEVTFPAGLAPNITDPPDSVSTATGQTVTFTVASRGASPLAYQWQKFNGSTWDDLANGGGVSGATTARLRLAAVDMADAGSYRVVVTNDSGSDTSAAATLTVVFGARVNFQPAGAPIPAGYLADSGAVFADRGNGHSYGWDSDVGNTARDRNSPRSPDQRFDTFVQTQRPVNPDAVWELAVPDGTYRVRVAAGDPIATTGVYRIDAEGVRVVRGLPSAANPWVIGTEVVTVTDGRLTLQNAPSARNVRLAFITVKRLGPADPAASFRFDGGAALSGGFTAALAPGLLDPSAAHANDSYRGGAAGTTDADRSSDNLWHHVAFARGATGAKPAPLAAPARTGHPVDSLAYFAGLDDLAASDRVPTADEVLSLV
jgi:glucose/arabinose dehydrogenase